MTATATATIYPKSFLDDTSSLNSYFICNSCNNRYTTKQTILRHVQVCGWQNLKCNICDISFKSQGNLVKHLRVHKDGIENHRIVKKTLEFPCTVCTEAFKEKKRLIMHIRKVHFNLFSKIPWCETKKVNQVWFEKVINSETVMEIKKTGLNVLVMRKLGPNTAIKITETKQDIVDLRPMYPTQYPSKRNEKAICEYCNKELVKRNISKHIEEKHLKLAKYQCDTCKAFFKRPYLFASHICFATKTRKRRSPENKEENVRENKSKKNGSFRAMLSNMMQSGRLQPNRSGYR